MAVRKPLTMISGKSTEIAPPDTLDPDVLPGVLTYVQQTDPGMTSPGVWWETDGSGNLVSLWIETVGV